MRFRRGKFLVVLAVIVAVFLAWRFVANRGADLAIERLRARGLPTNPAELDVWYKAVPAAENLATPILDASAAYRQPRDTTLTPYVGLLEVPPHAFGPTLAAGWKADLDESSAVFVALATARTRTASRYPVNLKEGFDATFPPYTDLERLVRFLALASLTHAESNLPHDAARDLRDMLLVARSLESNPHLVSQWVRIRMLQTAVNATATSLPRAGAYDADWKSLQTEFARAASVNGLFNGLVGESVLQGAFFHSSPSEFAATLASGGTPAMGTLGSALYIASGLRAVDERFYLDRIAEALDAAQSPFPEGLRKASAQNERVRMEMARPLRGMKIISGMILPALGKSVDQAAWIQANLRAAIAACAVERHRLAHGNQLPASLDELVPAFLDAVPLDPFDGKPLRYRATNDTYVVYSVGADLVDDGGETPRIGEKERATYDIAFRITDRRK